MGQQKQNQCHVCEKVFKLKTSLKVHLNRHVGRKFACEICKKTFLASYSLKIHLQTHKGHKPFSCSCCDATFNTREQLQQHRKFHKNTTKEYIQRFSKPGFTLEEAKKSHTRKVQCVLCGKLFASLTSYNRHRWKHLGRRFYCTKCPKSFTSSSAMKCHDIIIHEGLKPWECSICGLKFGRKTHLQRHEFVHTGRRDYMCEHCGKGFSSNQNVRTHINQIHEKRTPLFPCDVCKKQYKSKNTLKQHLKIHNNQRDFKCKLCSRAFIQKISYQDHMKGHEKGESLRKRACFVKPTEFCHLCKKAFANKTGLRRHIRKHELGQLKREKKLHQVSHDTNSYMYHTIVDIKDHPAETFKSFLSSEHASKMRGAVERSLTLNHNDTELVKVIVDDKFAVRKKVLHKYLIVPNFKDEISDEAIVSGCQKPVESTSIVDDTSVFNLNCNDKKKTDAFSYSSAVSEQLIVSNANFKNKNKKVAISSEESHVNEFDFGEDTVDLDIGEFTAGADDHDEASIVGVHGNQDQNREIAGCKSRDSSGSVNIIPLSSLSTKPDWITIRTRSEDCKDTKVDTSVIYKNSKARSTGKQRISETVKSVINVNALESQEGSNNGRTSLIESSVQTVKENKEQLRHANKLRIEKNPRKIMKKTCKRNIMFRKRKCHVCYKNFTTFSLAKFHSQKHTNDKVEKCEICEYPFKRLSGCIVKKACKCSPKCPLCSKMFPSKLTLYSHMKFEHEPVAKEKNLTKISASGKDDIKIKNKNCVEVLEKCVGTYEERKRSKPSVRPMYECEICPEKMNSRLDHAHHMRNEHGIEKPVKCDLCGVGFQSDSGLNKHKKKHISGTADITIIRHYMCNICGRSYTTNDSLKSHMLLHKNPTPFECPVCANKFTRQCHLKRHMKSKHEGLKQLHCEHCGKAFVDKWALKCHMRSHTGEKPYACKLCEKSFITASSRNVHIKQMHEKLRPFACTRCGADFTAKKSLEHHLSRHEKEDRMNPESVNYDPNFKARVIPVKKMAPKNMYCDLCGRTFTSKKGLQTHRKQRCPKFRNNVTSNMKVHGTNSETLPYSGNSEIPVNIHVRNGMTSLANTISQSTLTYTTTVINVQGSELKLTVSKI
ncbi:zinc finger protein 271-like [Mya arenaria]|uniref:zinc finger protein 271-like n=1 Tax=Mya arenaria TaxID=6604 RepID=UPI0022E1B122|nr:zinc finger protein 271-like [Mya arenaria]XP_052773082.1 zinc finger protein 271-like [Mya arenaria]